MSLERLTADQVLLVLMFGEGLLNVWETGPN